MNEEKVIVYEYKGNTDTTTHQLAGPYNHVVMVVVVVTWHLANANEKWCLV